MEARAYYERLMRQVNNALLRDDGPMMQYHERLRRDGPRSEVEQSILDKIDEIRELEREIMYGGGGVGGQFRYLGGFDGGDFGRGGMVIDDGSRLQRIMEMVEQMRARDGVGHGRFDRGGMGHGRPFG